MIDIQKYGIIRIATASPELRVANIDFNVNNIIKLIDETIKEGCSILLTPEMSLTGYTCGDLLYQQVLLDEAIKGLERIRRHTQKTLSAVIVGMPLLNGGRLYNCAVFVASGQITGVIPKSYLCNTNQYFEERWFSSEFDRLTDNILINGEDIPFGADIIFQSEDEPNLKIGIEICEDFWALVPPSSYQAMAGCNVLFNLSASDEFIGKTQKRHRFIRTHSQRLISAYIYSASSPWESSTDIVYSGHSIIAENGIILDETKRYSFNSEYVCADIDYRRLDSKRINNNTFAAAFPPIDFRIVEFKLEQKPVENFKRPIKKNPYLSEDKSYKNKQLSDVFQMQTTGLIRRMKHIGTNTAVIGISGGVDSTLALLVVWRVFEEMKLDKSGIIAITMPGFGTTGHTKTNAENLADILGIKVLNIDIKKSVTQHFEEINHDPNNKDIVFENAQARQRTMILMDMANKHNGIVIGTGDLSEQALGWSTYSGDHMSMYNVNAGLPKTIVQELILYISEQITPSKAQNILESIVDTPISPELLPPEKSGNIAQKTESSIGPYELHDFFIYYSVFEKLSPEKLLLLAGHTFQDIYDKNEIAHWLEVFYKRFFSQQFKRSCSPDGIRIFDFSMSPRGDLKMPSDADSKIWINKIKS